MEILKTNLEGCFKIVPNKFCDERGFFIKTFHYDTFLKYGLRTDFKESYYSISNKNVLRGMHFQLFPSSHAKIVYCLDGNLIDVVLDLRKKSPTFGKYEVFNLNSENKEIIYMEEGFAHGFYSLTDNTIMVYNVTSVYDAKQDSGIKYDSFGYKWPIENKPIISDRDNNFLDLKDFNLDKI